VSLESISRSFARLTLGARKLADTSKTSPWFPDKLVLDTIPRHHGINDSINIRQFGGRSIVTSEGG
jgi:hypothetical protein